MRTCSSTTEWQPQRRRRLFQRTLSLLKGRNEARLGSSASAATSFLFFLGGGLGTKCRIYKWSCLEKTLTSGGNLLIVFSFFFPPSCYSFSGKACPRMCTPFKFFSNLRSTTFGSLEITMRKRKIIIIYSLERLARHIWALSTIYRGCKSKLPALVKVSSYTHSCCESYARRRLFRASL